MNQRTAGSPRQTLNMDVAGNQIRAQDKDGAWIKMDYDYANRLSVVKKDDGTSIQAFQYAPSGTRLMNADYTTYLTTFYANLGGTTLAEYHEYTSAVPTWTKSYTYLGDSQLATITPNGSGGEAIDFNHPDRLGTRTITNQQLGTSYEQTTLPFGTALNAESTVQNNKKRFTSYDRSAVTGLDYAVNRTYDSKQGRFTQVDPIGLSAASLASPQTLNLYTYCGNDPINHTDPSGLFFGKLFRAIGRIFSAVNRVLKWVAIVVAVILVAALIIAFTPIALPAFLGDFLGSFIGVLSSIGAGASSFLAGAIGVEIGAAGGFSIAAGLYAVGSIASQFARKPGPKTRAFCRELEGIIDKIRPIINQVWNGSDYGTPNARERGGLISYSNRRGWFGKAYPGSPDDSNISLDWGGWINNQLNTPRGTYDTPGGEVYNVFLIHSHPFDSHKSIKVKGGYRNGAIVKSDNVEKPSGTPGGLRGDVNSLPPTLIGIIVTNGAINIYTRVGRRCNFRR